MNVKGKKNRLFGACILLMMAVLTICTVTFAAAEENNNTSYSLIIKKLFDVSQVPEDLQDNVEEEAKNQKYTFKVTGTRKAKDEKGNIITVPVEFTFTLPRENVLLSEDEKWTSEVYKSEGPFDVTVTELTDNIEICDSAGNHYNMSNSSSDTNMSINSRSHEVQLKNGSILTISRPQANDNSSQALWYRLTNRPYDNHHPTSNYTSVDISFPLSPGETKVCENLCAAVYTIEQIAAPDGYQIQMGERTENVGVGKAGSFYINGTPGTLTLTAGGTAGDGVTHYYTISRTAAEEGDASHFEERTVSIASGASYVCDNLPRGEYAVTEYTFGAGEAFEVTFPQTIERTRTGTSSALTSGTQSSWKYISLYDENFDVDYIKMVSFGPLYNSSGNKLNNSTSYAVFRFGIASDDGTKITNIKTYSKTNDVFLGGKTVTISDAEKTKISTVDSFKRLYITVTGLKSSTAKTIGISWIEYDEKETQQTLGRAGEIYSLTVDDRKWITIKAPALSDPDAAGAHQIAYYYTLKDQNDNLIQGTTDIAGTTVKLLPGNSVRLELPSAGSYTIVETITGNNPVGFTMKINGMPFGTTEANTPIKVKTGGERTVTVSKPALVSPPDKAEDPREYTFSVSGTNFSGTITVKSGESNSITLPHAGTYTITPQGETLETYGLNYKDSNAIYGTASGSESQITFTNSFRQGAYGYRFVHEYYIREADGTYTYVGNSQISTRLGIDNVDMSVQALDLYQAPNFNENRYEHFDDAYGLVDPVKKSESDIRALSDENVQELPAQEMPVQEEEEISDSKETAPSNENILNSSDSETQESSGEDITNPSDSETQESSGEDITTPSDGETQESSGEDITNPSDSETQEASGEDFETPSGNSEPETTEAPDEIPTDSSDSTLPITLNEASEYLSEGGKPRTFYNESRKAPRLLSSTTYDDTGIVNKGAAYTWDKDAEVNDAEIHYGPESMVHYEPQSDKDHIKVTTDASQIVILRYYRERQPEGKYNVIHVYYRRDENGDHWEGISGILPQNGELGIKYTGRSVDKIYSFQPDGAEQPYVYTWDMRPQYGIVENTGDTNDSGNEFAGNGMIYRPNNAWTAAEGTKEGNQIIILRYYREPGKEGSYRIVHEYYFREDGESQADIPEGSGQKMSVRALNDNLRTGEIDKIGDIEDDSFGAVFAGTLNSDDGFIYTFEGSTQTESVIAPLGTVHTAGEGDWRLTYEGNSYTYMNAGYGAVSDNESYYCDSNQQWAASTVRGEDVIILRYFREDSLDSPDTPDIPNNPGNPGGSTARRGENVPGTGDNSCIALWTALAAGSLIGLFLLPFSFCRKKQEAGPFGAGPAKKFRNKNL